MSLLGAALRDLTNSRAMDVAIVDANGDQITSFSTTPPTPPSSGAITSVAQANVDTVLLASNAARKKFHIYNAGTKPVKVALDGAASATNFSFVIPQNDSYESDLYDYTGTIHGIWDGSGGGFARVTELT